MRERPEYVDEIFDEVTGLTRHIIPGYKARRAVAAMVVLLALAVAGCRGRKYDNPISKDTQQPDKVLFDKGIREIEKGRYEVARLTLNTLINTYDTSEFLAKAKLAIADSWMREGGSNGYAQAEAEYKDFILFYPTMEEAAEAQMKICDMQYKQMVKPDRDSIHMIRAEEECRLILTQFPNSRFAPIAAQKLRDVQETISEGEYRVGAFYHQKGSFHSASNRLDNLTQHYPLFSNADDALLRLGDSYGRMGARFRPQSIQAYQKLVREYPLSPLIDEAKKRLTGMEAEVPEADPVAVARMKYEQENQISKGFWGRNFGFFSIRPDITMAAKSGQPTMTTLRPSIPATIPIPGAAGQQGVSDVTAEPVLGADTSALDNQPDARLNQPGARPAEPSEDPQPTPDPKKADTKKQSKKK
jgi:outer membrane protein assembly factor BamD